MEIKQLSVKNFRGIKNFQQDFGGEKFICLVGPGDSTKSTILDAIEMGLSSKWNINFNDADFHNCNTAEPIEIVVTVSGDLPSNLLTENAFGLYKRGWREGVGLIPEPEEKEDEVALSIRLRVDDSLEPSWDVFSDQHPEGKKISSSYRRYLNLIRLGANTNKHFIWSYGSALTHYTAIKDVKNAQEMARILADANRCAKKEIDDADLPELQAIATAVQEAASGFGVSKKSGYKPSLDFTSQIKGIGPLSLHDGDIPLSYSGLGSRRLIIFALQKLLLSTVGSIVVIDEIEHGLEPYRLRSLIFKLKEALALHVSQILITTHSPVVITEVDAEEIFVTRSEEGKTSVFKCSNELQDTIRVNAEALLSRKIIICEGKTEMGMVRSLKKFWNKSHEYPLEYLGISYDDGGSTASAVKRAQHLKRMGYSVAIYIDSDKATTPSAEELESSGIKVVKYSEGFNFEKRLFTDADVKIIPKIVELAAGYFGEEPVFDSIRSNLPSGYAGDDIAAWLTAGLDEQVLKGALTKSALGMSWFKKITPAEKLGDLIVEEFHSYEKSEMADCFRVLENWCYHD